VRGSKAHAWLYRVTGGRVLGAIGGNPILLLTTTGRHSGLARTTPVEYQRIGGNLVVVASNRGARAAPAWYRNLVTNPHVTVHIGSEELGCRARVAAGTERDEIWEELRADNPWLARASQRARRRLPVVVLERS
jgi:deazaflavin-dependent oxidoreductase (nitroreductase family)